MSARQQAQCTPTCALYRGPLSLQNAAGIEPGICAPFPAGIPADIWEGRFDHRKAHPDQVGAETWTARAEGVRFPSYALHVPQDPSAAALVADATEAAMTGAMIALVPSAVDIERLAIPGGEAPGDLHLTLLYLGEAAAIGEPWRQQLIDWVTNDLAPTWDYVEAEGFAPAWFNPTGDEPCLVMVCSGGDLAEIYESVLAEVTETVADLPEQHAPWIPHVMLFYADTGRPGLPFEATVEEQGFPRTGPISFDRIRLAFAGEIFDIPLGSGAEVAPAEAESAETTPLPAPVAVDVEVVATGAGPMREVWDGPLRGI